MITPEKLVNLYNTRATEYGNMYAAFDIDEKLYELAFLGDLALPKEFKDMGVVLPTARNTVDTFADYIGIDNVRVNVSRRKESKEANEQAEELRRFARASST